jgi:hypothetical protein
MTTLSELCADVFTLTNRPDLVSETQLALRHATQKMHLLDFWSRDRAERQLSFATAAMNFSASIPSNFENWRKFAYVRPFDPDTLTPKDRYINEIAPDKLFDEFNRNKTDVYYVAGTLLNMKTRDSESAFLFGWYKYPNTTVAGYASWIADMYPAIIVEEAAGRILHVIGMVEEGNKFVDPRIGSVYHPITGHLQALRVNELEASAR